MTASTRIGTWNLDARHQQPPTDLLLDLDCDVLLLTEVSRRLELPGYSKVLTGGVMARGQHWAGVFSRRPLEPLPETHPASATARIDGQVFCSSILPWRACGSGEPWESRSSRFAVSADCPTTTRTSSRSRPDLKLEEGAATIGAGLPRRIQRRRSASTAGAVSGS